MTRKLTSLPNTYGDLAEWLWSVVALCGCKLQQIFGTEF